MKFFKKREKKKKKKRENKRLIQLISFICGSISIGVRVLVLLMFLWSSIGCSIVFMAFSSTLPRHLSTSFPLPLSPHYNP